MHKLARYFVSCALVCAGAWVVQAHAVGVTLSAGNLLLPVGWRATIPPISTMDGFGMFDVGTRGTGSTRQNPLTFTITGVDGDSALTYTAETSTGVQGTGLFAARVAGFDGPGPISSACTPVPVPAAVWLFGSGLIGLIGIGRRKKTTTAA